jgi:uncharacterized protein
MFLRILLVALAVGVVIWLLRSRRVGSSGQGQGQGEGGSKKVAAPGRMVRCAVCALHLPASDAVAEGETFYCGEAHRAAARSGRG